MFEDVKVEELSIFDDIFNSAKNGRFEVPDGSYIGQVHSVILTKTKRDNTPMIILKFIDDETDWPVDIVHVLSIKAIPFLKKNLMAIGFPAQGNFSQNLKGFVEKFSMPIHVKLKKETYTTKNGKDYSDMTLSPHCNDSIAKIENSNEINTMLTFTTDDFPY